MQNVVGIDVETTSLHANEGDIIEIAAIRYDWKTGAEVDRLELLCSAREPLSDFTTNLTGITNEMVANQPSFSEVAADVADYIGSEPIFAHNASFDVGWLRHHGVPLEQNDIWDTFPLATIAWPEAESYNLGTLAHSLNIESDIEHRAGPDVEVNWRLLQKIREQLSLSEKELQTAQDVLTRGDLQHYAPIFSLYKGTGSNNTKPTPSSTEPNGAEDTSIEATRDVLMGITNKTADTEQLRLYADLQTSLQSKKPLLAEAPQRLHASSLLTLAATSATTTGPVVISTHSQQLHAYIEQTLLPLCAEALQTTCTTATVTRRKHYVCNQRLQGLLGAKSPLTSVDAFMLLKIALWHGRYPHSTLDQLNHSHVQSDVPAYVCADAISCRSHCSTTTQCPYNLAIAKASKADIVVTLHTALLELHDTDALDTQAASLVVQEPQFLSEDIRNSTALNLQLNQLQQICSAISHAAAAENSDQIRTLSVAMLSDYQALLSALEQVVARASSDDAIVLTPSVRSSSTWRSAMKTWKQYTAASQTLLGLVQSGDPKDATVLPEAIASLEQFTIEMAQFMEGNSERAQWLSLYQFNDTASLELHDHSLYVNELLEAHVGSFATHVLASPALSSLLSSSDFSSNLFSVAEVAIYGTATEPSLMVYVVEDAPLPSDPNFAAELGMTTSAIAENLRGHTLVLTTSKRASRDVFAIASNANTESSDQSMRRYTEPRISYLGHGVNGGARNTSEQFRRKDHAVLIGSDESFWSSVTTSTHPVTCAIIAKLPFPNPYDPILQSLETQEGRATFGGVSIPHMITRTRIAADAATQGAGKRTVMVIFDSRTSTKSYGQELLAALTSAKIVRGNTADLTQHIQDWLSVET